MVFKTINKILAVGAHPDDIEMGCGGLIAKALAQNVEVYTAIMSKCEDEMEREDGDLRSKEFEASIKTLGIKNFYIYNYPNRHFPEHEAEIRDTLAELQTEIKPEMILIPSLDDPHQDHKALAYACIRTFRIQETILQYEVLRHGSHSFTPTLFVDISDYLDIKLEALKCYKSQFDKRPYFDLESFKSLARTRGAQSAYPYAEGFKVYKIYI
jgi:LmbE family N-acetylglucosaminyl deacetylase